MCGGKSTTTQSTTIPPEVLARYNAVNARAEDVAQQPFQRYTGEFVAPLTATQQAGIYHTNYYANLPQGALADAAQTMSRGYGQAEPLQYQGLKTASQGYGQGQGLLGQSQSYLANAASQGQIYGGQAYQPIAGALSSAQPYMQSATQLIGGGLGAAAPMMGAAEGYLGGGTQAVNPQEFGQAQINKYMSPYMKNVVEAQQALQQQESAAQRSALNSQAIGAGAFGGDRAGIAQANLARQQSLANQATLGNLLQQGYGQAAGMFQQQQGVNLAAQQANRQAQQFGSQQAANLAQQRYAQQMGAGQQLAALGQQQFAQNIGAGQALAGLGQQMYQQGLGASQAYQGLGQTTAQMAQQLGAFEQGTGANLNQLATQQAQNQAALALQRQQSGLAGAQAQIGAGTLEQQTQQALDTALYNQFQQERGYPFQIAQFLANIAMGTGALSGSTTTTTQPNSFFSDRRLKKDIKEIGETHDGLPIYSFKYKGGDEQQRIGVMADEAREKHPDAVHRVGGVDAVDYEKIANRASEGGGVMPHRAGEGFAEGGHVNPEDLAAIIAMQKQFLGPHGQGGLYGQSAQNMPGQKGVVPLASLPVSRLPRHSPPQQQQSGMRQAMSELGQAERLGESLLGDKGLFTSKGLPARAARAVGIMPAEQAPAAQKQASPQQQPAAAPAQGGAGTAKSLGVVKDYSQPRTSDASPSMGGVMPETKVASADVDSITPLDEDIISPSMFANRGGVVPHKAGGGKLQEKILPYQSDDPYGLEAVNEAESGEQHELLGEKSGGKGGSSGPSGASQLSSAIGLAGTAAKAAPAIMEGITALAAMLPFSDERVKNGMERVGKLDNGQPVYKYRIGDGPTQLGLSAQNVSKYGDPSAVHRDKDGLLHLDYERATREYGGGVRPTFQEGGDAPKKNPLVEYRDYMIEKGLEPHVAAGIAGNIAKESNGNPTIWGDNDNSFGLFQKNIRGELPAYQKWAQENKRDMNDPKAQIDHVIERLNGPYAKVYQQMRESNDPAQAAYQFAVGYERPVPATARYEERMKIAAQLAGGEYTGKGVAPQGEPRRQVAGAEYVREPGQKGVTMVDGQPVQEGGLSGLMPTNFRTGKPFTSVGDFLTDRQFLVPLLSGVGAMASSPSRYFGGALLQGIGAAAQSYGGMEKTQQEIAESKAREMDYLTNAANNAIFERGGVTYVRLANGQEVTLDRWIENQEPLTGGAAVAQAAIDVYRRKTGQEPPATNASGAVNPNVAAKPSPGVAIPLPQFVSYDDSVTQRAKADMQSGMVKGGQEFSLEAAKERAKINNGANSARSVAPLVNEMSRNVADSLALTGLATSGPGFNNIATAAGLLNSWAQRFGFNVDFSNAADVKAKSEKYAAMLSAMAAQGVGQETLGAMQRLYDAMPNPEMPRSAQAQLAAELLVFNKKDQHRQDFTQRYNKDSMNTPASAASEFERVNGQKYLDAVSVVKNIMIEDPKLFSGLMRGEIPPKQLEDLLRRYSAARNLKYAPGMSDFFVGR